MFVFNTLFVTLTLSEEQFFDTIHFFYVYSTICTIETTVKSNWTTDFRTQQMYERFNSPDDWACRAVYSNSNIDSNRIL